MKGFFTKRIIFTIVAILLIGSSAAAYLVPNDEKQESNVGQNTSSSTSEGEEVSNSGATEQQPVEAKKACDIFTLEDARKILGSNAVTDASNSEQRKDSDHIVITNCKYGAGNREASLLARTAKDEEGSANDKAQFSTQRPSTAVEVRGYGDVAYWNADFAELNILKGNVWYIITNGSQLAPERNLDDAKKLADLLEPKL